MSKSTLLHQSAQPPHPAWYTLTPHPSPCRPLWGKRSQVLAFVLCDPGHKPSKIRPDNCNWVRGTQAQLWISGNAPGLMRDCSAGVLRMGC